MQVLASFKRTAFASTQSERSIFGCRPMNARNGEGKKESVKPNRSAITLEGKELEAACVPGKGGAVAAPPFSPKASSGAFHPSSGRSFLNNSKRFPLALRAADSDSLRASLATLSPGPAGTPRSQRPPAPEGQGLDGEGRCAGPKPALISWLERNTDDWEPAALDPQEYPRGLTVKRRIEAGGESIGLVTYNVIYNSRIPVFVKLILLYSYRKQNQKEEWGEGSIPA
ncbi:hypothetical protein H8959_018608 [Pygathrix nigripes]